MWVWEICDFKWTCNLSIFVEICHKLIWFFMIRSVRTWYVEREYACRWRIVSAFVKEYSFVVSDSYQMGGFSGKMRFWNWRGFVKQDCFWRSSEFRIFIRRSGFFGSAKFSEESGDQLNEVSLVLCLMYLNLFSIAIMKILIEGLWWCMVKDALVMIRNKGNKWFA